MTAKVPGVHDALNGLKNVGLDVGPDVGPDTHSRSIQVFDGIAVHLLL